MLNKAQREKVFSLNYNVQADPSEQDRQAFIQQYQQILTTIKQNYKEIVTAQAQQ